MVHVKNGTKTWTLASNFSLAASPKAKFLSHSIWEANCLETLKNQSMTLQRNKMKVNWMCCLWHWPHGQWNRPGREVWVRDQAGSTCCVLRQNTSLSQCLSLSSQEYTWVLANCQESLVTSHLGGSDNTPTIKTGISSGWVGQQAWVQTTFCWHADRWSFVVPLSTPASISGYP